MRVLCVAALCAIVAPVAADPYMGVGGLTLPASDKIGEFADMLSAAGLNHVQCGIPTGDDDVAQRVKYLQDRGFTVFGVNSAFIGLRGEREDYQIKADGSVKKGWVCPRSARRIREMIETTNRVADTGVDGFIWDFITVESRTKEACFCPACVAAFNKAAGTGKEFTREQLVAALDTDPEVLKVWKRVRGESTNEALRQVVEAAHEHRADLKVGGYVINPGNDLGMDTEGLSHILDVLAPMIYQGRGRAPVGWMRKALKVFTGLTGDAEIIECVDTGFWVDEPVAELINTTWDCHRAGIDGWALWPFSPVSAEDLAGVAVVSMFAGEFHAPLIAGDKDAAVAGLRKVLEVARQTVLASGDDKQKARLSELYGEGRPDSPVAQALKDWEKLNADDEAAAPIAKLLHLRAAAAARELHESDKHFRAGEYEVTFSEAAGSVTVSTPEWVATQNRLALNIDELRFKDLIGNASTDPHNLGLLRTRINPWFDPWGAAADVAVEQTDAETVAITVFCAHGDCRLGRVWRLRAGQPWMAVDVFVENVGDEPRKGNLWVWNGVGIPGFLEGNANAPWQDDKAEILEQNILVISDEGRFVAIGADPKLWKMPKPGNGMSHLFHEVELAPGERFTTRLYVAFGEGYPEGWEVVLERYAGEF